MAHDEDHRMDKIFNYLRAKQGVIVGRGHYPGPYPMPSSTTSAVTAVDAAMTTIAASVASKDGEHASTRATA